MKNILISQAVFNLTKEAGPLADFSIDVTKGMSKMIQNFDLNSALSHVDVATHTANILDKTRKESEILRKLSNEHRELFQALPKEIRREIYGDLIGGYHKYIAPLATKKASLLALVGHALLGHLGQNIIAHATMTKKPALDVFKHHFQAGLRGLNVTHETSVAKGMLAPVFTEGKIVADHMHELGTKFGENLKKHGLSIAKMDAEHHDFIDHLTKGNFNIAAQKLKKNSAKLKPVLDSLTEASHGIKSAEGLHQALREIPNDNRMALARFSPLYKKSVTSKILNHVTKPITHEEAGVLARAAHAKPTNAGTMAEIGGNLAIAAHDPGIALGNAVKRIATSKHVGKLHPFLAKMQSKMTNKMLIKPVIAKYHGGLSGKLQATSPGVRKFNTIAWGPGYADVAALSQDAGVAFKGSSVLTPVANIRSQLNSLNSGKEHLRASVTQAKDTVANNKHNWNQSELKKRVGSLSPA